MGHWTSCKNAVLFKSTSSTFTQMKDVDIAAIYGDCNVQHAIHLNWNYEVFNSSAKAYRENKILSEEIWI